MRPPAPNMMKLDSNSVIDFYVMSCVHTVVDKLTDELFSFPSVFNNLYNNTYRNVANEGMSFDSFYVNATYEHAALFGAVYFVLALQQKVGKENLSYLEETFTKEDKLKAYFLPFKDAAEKKLAELLNSNKGKDDVKRLTAAQAGLFCEVFLASRNCTYKNKKVTIPPLASSLFGWAISTMERNLTYTNDDKNHVADIFKDIDPEFSKLVRNFEKKEIQINLHSDHSNK